VNRERYNWVELTVVRVVAIQPQHSEGDDLGTTKHDIRSVEAVVHRLMEPMPPTTLRVIKAVDG